MASTEHPQCWKHPFKKTTKIYVNALWQVILFVSLTGLRNFLSINEAHLWVHLWGHFHRFNREGTIHLECQQCHLMRWGLGPNGKGWRRKGESHLMPAFPAFHFFPSFSSSPPLSSFFPLIIWGFHRMPLITRTSHSSLVQSSLWTPLQKKKMLREGKSPICVVIQLLEHDQIPRGQSPKENEPFLTATASSRHLLWRATL